LAASIRLVHLGYRVEVFEGNSYPGGKLLEIQLGDYRFDAGPSLFSPPDKVEELFKLAGRNPAEHFEYIKLPVACHYFWEDGKQVKAYGDVNQFVAEVENQLGDAPDHIIKSLQRHSIRKKGLSYRHYGKQYGFGQCIQDRPQRLEAT
jgi:phytoene dehydrogenase-like protein